MKHLKEESRRLAEEIINSLPSGRTFCEADYEDAEGYAKDALMAAYKAGQEDGKNE